MRQMELDNELNNKASLPQFDILVFALVIGVLFAVTL